MRSFVLSLAVLVLTVFALQTLPSRVEMHLSQENTLQEANWETGLVAMPIVKKEFHHSFGPVTAAPVSVSIVQSTVNPAFDFYLPIFSLYRPKNYFLLV